MGHSTETSTFGTARCLKIYIYFLHLNLGHIIRLPFDFINTCKRQLNYYYYLEFLCNYFKTTCVIFVSGVAFFSNIKSFYETLFLVFLCSAHVVRVTEK